MASGPALLNQVNVSCVAEQNQIWVRAFWHHLPIYVGGGKTHNHVWRGGASTQQQRQPTDNKDKDFPAPLIGSVGVRRGHDDPEPR